MTNSTDGVRSYAVIDRLQFERYSFKIGESGGMPVIAKTWIVGVDGSIARVDGGDPGDEHDGE